MLISVLGILRLQQLICILEDLLNDEQILSLEENESIHIIAFSTTGFWV